MPRLHGDAHFPDDEVNTVTRAGIELVEHMVISTYPDQDKVLEGVIFNANKNTISTIWVQTIDALAEGVKFRFNKELARETKAFQETILEAVEKFNKPFKVRQAIGLYNTFVSKSKTSYFIDTMSDLDPSEPLDTRKAIISLYMDLEAEVLTYAIMDYLKAIYHNGGAYTTMAGALSSRFAREGSNDVELELNPIHISMAGSAENLTTQASRRAKLKMFMRDFINLNDNGSAKRYIKDHYDGLLNSYEEYYGSMDDSTKNLILNELEEQFNEELEYLYSDSFKATKELVYRLLNIAIMKLTMKAYKHRYIKLIALVLMIHTIAPGSASSLEVNDGTADGWSVLLQIDIKKAREKFEDEDIHDQIELDDYNLDKGFRKRGW